MGGVLTVAGLVDSMIFSGSKKLKGIKDDGFGAPNGKMVRLSFLPAKPSQEPAKRGSVVIVLFRICIASGRSGTEQSPVLLADADRLGPSKPC